MRFQGGVTGLKDGQGFVIPNSGGDKAFVMICRV